MKITLDMDKLLEEGKINPSDYEALKGYAHDETTSLALNIFLGFGAVAVSLGMIALMASSGATMLIGLIVGASGISLGLYRAEREPLGSILTVIGALMFGGGVLSFSEGAAGGFLIVAVIYGVAAMICNSGLMTGLSATALFGMVGAIASYGHAQYTLGTDKPLLTIVVFSALYLASYYLSVRIPSEESRLITVFSRMCLIFANIGFWIGSLWGDNLFADRDYDKGVQAAIPDMLFALVWAGVLIGLALWANRENQRWALNTAAVFGGILLYTQWFERLGASPISVVIGGAIAIILGYVLLTLNRDWSERRHIRTGSYLG